MATHPDPPLLLERSSTIAVVGFSANPGKAAHSAPMLLVRRGWDVIPVNPNADEVAGMPTVARLADIDRHVDLVNVFRPSHDAAEVAQAAAAIGADALWLQLGIRSAAAAAIASEAGMEFVEDQCAGAMAQAMDLHPPEPAGA